MLKIYNQYKLKYFWNISPFLPTVPEISETTKWIVVNLFMNTPSFCDQKRKANSFVLIAPEISQKTFIGKPLNIVFNYVGHSNIKHTREPQG